jgi:hypothetical protein
VNELPAQVVGRVSVPAPALDEVLEKIFADVPAGATIAGAAPPR